MTKSPERTKLTLRAKLRLGILFASGFAMILVCTAFLIYDHVSFDDQMKGRLLAFSELLGQQSRPAVASRDARTAMEVLYALSTDPGIVSAAIYTPEGALFARYVRSGEPLDLIPGRPGPEGIRRESNHLGVFRSIPGAGTVYVRSDMSEAGKRFRLNAMMAGVALLVIQGLSFLLSPLLEKIITVPLGELAETVSAVASQRDYGIRARKEGSGEMTVLIDGFNDMLSQIQIRDGALQIARNELENRIEERTAELTFVNQELSSEIAERRRVEESLRESEQAMRTLVEYAPDATFIIDVETGRFIDVNRSAIKLFGHEGSKLMTMGFMDVSAAVQPEGRPSAEVAFERLQEAISGGAPRFEWLHQDVQGSPVPCEVHLVRLPSTNRVLIRGSVMDITKRKEIERMKNEFVSTVSHELRTPITSIQGSLGLIANGVTGALPPAAKPLVDIAYKNCQRLVLLINDILDSEKIAAGKMVFTFKVQELMPLVEQAIESNRAFGQQFGVRFELAAGVEDAKVEADADRLIQVLTNLLANAAKFSPQNDVVTVSVRREAGQLRISVVDRGPGIPAEFRARIFGKFAQADASDIRQKGGTGLGLSISKALVEKHHGTVRFETETGRGTTFIVELPEVCDEPAPAACEATTGFFRSIGGPAEVLHVEPDTNTRQLVAFTLRGAARVTSATTLEQARALLGGQPFDLMILNTDLPDGSGLELMSLVNRPGSPRIPTVVFNRRCSGTGITQFAASSLLKALALQKDLPPSLDELVGRGVRPLEGAHA